MKRRKLMAAALAAALSLGLLAGCQPDPAHSPVPSPSPAESQSPSPAPSPTAAPALTDPLSAEELDELEQWLNAAGRREMFLQSFSSPEEVDVAVLLHDGAGVTDLTRTYSPEEVEQLRALGSDDVDACMDEYEEGLSVLGARLTGEQINGYLDEVLGITLTEEQLQQRVVEQSRTNGWGEWYYVADTDTYYHFSNGTSGAQVSCQSGSWREDGSLVVTCETGFVSSGTYQAELTPTQTGWRFQSVRRLDGGDRGEGAPLTQEELDELSALLSENGVCQLFWSGFTSVDDVDLSQLFYDGAGLEQGALTQGERDELAAQGAELSLDVVKVTTEQIGQVLAERFRATLSEDQIRARLSDWYYLAEYDAYYHCHGDTLMQTVTCTQGTQEDGSLFVTCQAEGGTFTAQINPDYDAAGAVLQCEVVYVRPGAD